MNHPLYQPVKVLQKYTSLPIIFCVCPASIIILGFFWLLFFERLSVIFSYIDTITFTSKQSLLCP